MTKFSFPTHHIDLLPAALTAKLHQYAELDTKRRILAKNVTAAEYAIPEGAKADTATRAAKLLGDKKAGEPNAEAAARVTLAGLQQELGAYAVAVNTVTAECRALAFSHKAEIRSAIADATNTAHARAVAAVDTLDAALTELSELASMTEWTDADFTRIKGAGVIRSSSKRSATCAPSSPRRQPNPPRLAPSWSWPTPRTWRDEPRLSLAHRRHRARTWPSHHPRPRPPPSPCRAGRAVRSRAHELAPAPAVCASHRRH